MQVLNNVEVDMVAGSDMDAVYEVAMAVTVGAGVGFLLGGPVGAFAGAASAGIHAVGIIAVM